ncbi:GNAT family N-acetyltransferase [Caballeronia sp. BR00000012568055]|uniref:GNAT family N-acetyltransferase n=1 Tax=Caballeronia sp. BR00000012568055 TaxID=2918761 RepID=UPI0023F94D7A|nr:GNAT family N-acetyltransferase [Caballeronia sp. BR00000012568055]
MPTSSDSPHFIVRRMRPGEPQLAIDWAAAEGWNPGLDDASTFHAADPEGFFIATFDDEPIGCMSAVAYGESLGFIGLYIVRPEWRGKGYGMQLWRAGMAYLGTRNIALDGVLAQQANYRKSGFVLAHRNVRYEGFVTGEHDGDLVDARRVPFDRLLQFDTHHFAAPRETFLRAWLDAPHANALAAVDGDTLRGYGVIRRCREGRKIGPLFAQDRRVARALFRALVATSDEGGKVVLDVPECNPAAVALAVEHEMTSVFETARMFTHAAPVMPLANIFGVTSFELG